jgi:hypothetical protein
MNIETETINRLFLELSQITTAKTTRELRLAQELEAMKLKCDTTWGHLNSELRVMRGVAIDLLRCTQSAKCPTCDGSGVIRYVGDDPTVTRIACPWCVQRTTAQWNAAVQQIEVPVPQGRRDG